METRDLFEKLDWGAGPWITEPDWALWTDEATGLRCMIRRTIFHSPHGDHGTGALCGYVEVPPDHPYHKVPKEPLVISEDMQHEIKQWMADWNTRRQDDHEYEFDALSCHGGCTFAGEILVTPPGEPKGEKVFFLGFDCAHAWDITPAMDAQMQKMYQEHPEWGVYRLRPASDNATYKDFAYVQNECRELARQIQEHAHDGPIARRSHDYGDSAD